MNIYVNDSYMYLLHVYNKNDMHARLSLKYLPAMINIAWYHEYITMNTQLHAYSTLHPVLCSWWLIPQPQITLMSCQYTCKKPRRVSHSGRRYTWRLYTFHIRQLHGTLDRIVQCMCSCTFIVIYSWWYNAPPPPSPIYLYVVLFIYILLVYIIGQRYIYNSTSDVTLVLTVVFNWSFVRVWLTAWTQLTSFT